MQRMNKVVTFPVFLSIIFLSTSFVIKDDNPFNKSPVVCARFDL